MVTREASRFTLIAGSIQLLLYVALLISGDVRPAIVWFLGVYLASFMVYALALHHGGRYFSSEAGRGAGGLGEMRLIVLFAVLFRLAMLPAAPELSDDGYRYLWDGRVWNSGTNPYLHAPIDPALAPLRDASVYPYINHAEIPTIYAPVLQYYFYVTYMLAPTRIGFKAVLLAFDLGVLWLLVIFLRRLGLSEQLAMVYAWNPLVIVETAGSGHLEVIGLFFLMLFFLSAGKRMPVAAGVSLAAATLTKFVGIVLAPFALQALHRRSRWRFASALGVAIILAYLPFADAGMKLFQALGTYSDRWEFNATVFRLALDAAVAFLPSVPYEAVMLGVKAALGAVFLLLFAFVLALTDFRRADALMRAWFILFGGLCILTPTLHPWYLIWMVPALAVFRNRAFLLLTGLLPISYFILERYHAEDVWEESAIVKLVVFTPFYAILLWDGAQAMRRARSRWLNRLEGTGYELPLAYGMRGSGRSISEKQAAGDEIGEQDIEETVADQVVQKDGQ